MSQTKKHQILGVWFVLFFQCDENRDELKCCLNIYRVDDNQIHKKTQTLEIWMSSFFVFFQQNFDVFHKWSWENGRKIIELMRYTYTEKERETERQTHWSKRFGWDDWSNRFSCGRRRPWRCPNCAIHRRWLRWRCWLFSTIDGQWKILGTADDSTLY